MEKLKMESVDMTQKNIEKIGKLFPNVITEIRDENGNLKKGINFELLKQELSGDVVDGEECYDFTWVGKKGAIIEGNAPIRKTLRPCIEESKDFESTGNLFIEGDNLDVLKLLQESCLNSIKLIYIDPPYNTGNDFLFNDSFKMDQDEYNEETGYFDDDGNIRFKKNEKTNPRYHSDWCSMLYPRLKLAHNLLTEDGVIFISIDDNEVDNLRKICNEVFGEDNFVAQLIWKSRQNKDNRNLTGVSIDHEYIVAYSKSRDYRALKGSDRNVSAYKNPDDDPRGDWTSANMVGMLSENQRPNCHYDLINPATGINYGKPKMGWRYDKNTMSQLIAEDRILWPTSEDGRPRRKVFLNELSGSLAGFSSIIGLDIYTRNGTLEIEQLLTKRYFDFPKPSKLIKELIKQTTDSNSIVLDFFPGSATTAHAAMELNGEDGGNRKFIMVQLPETIDETSEACKAGYKNICEIGKERIRRAGDKINEDIIKKNSRLKVGEEAKPLVDIGFRVLKVDSTNMKDVYYAANEYSQSMLAGLESNIKEDRTDLDLLYGVLLDWGLPLSLNHKIEEIEGVSVHTVDEGSLVACFAQKISEGIVREIAKRQPLRVVFRDSSFTNSPDKINVEEIFKLLAPNTTVKVI